jgi:hypothetical protein
MGETARGTDHDLRDHLCGDVFRVAQRGLALCVQYADLVLDLNLHCTQILALHLRGEPRELALLRLRVHLLRRVPVLLRRVRPWGRGTRQLGGGGRWRA